MKIPRTSVRFETVVAAVSLLLFVPAALANTTEEAVNSASLSLTDNDDWNEIISGMEYLAKHRAVIIITPDKTAGEGSATGVKETAVDEMNTNPFIAKFKGRILKNIQILYVHGYYTLFQARHLSYVVRNADIAGDDATVFLQLIGKLGAAN